jgi:hypothetical protein
MPRDNFSQPIKTELSLRAAHFCSNPRYLRLTAGPRSGLLRGLATGHAAHICAASLGGSRYDPDQSEAERRSAANGLWLCRESGGMVDISACQPSLSCSSIQLRPDDGIRVGISNFR